MCRAGAIETFLIANLSANAVLLQNIIDQNELMGLEIDHAIERPDTLVDDCMVRNALEWSRRQCEDTFITMNYDEPYSHRPIDRVYDLHPCRQMSTLPDSCHGCPIFGRAYRCYLLQSRSSRR